MKQPEKCFFCSNVNPDPVGSRTFPWIRIRNYLFLIWNQVKMKKRINYQNCNSFCLNKEYTVECSFESDWLIFLFALLFFSTFSKMFTGFGINPSRIHNTGLLVISYKYYFKRKLRSPWYCRRHQNWLNKFSLKQTIRRGMEGGRVDNRWWSVS